jgi:hypothetical protein
MRLSFWLAFLILLPLPSLAGSHFSPPPTDENGQTRAQGTRGCPIELGELYLMGKDLTTQLSKPTLLFWVDTPQTATISISVDDPDLNQLEPIFWQKVTVNGSGYLPVKIPQTLEKGIRYRVVAGILCNGVVANASILETSLTRVDAPTLLDQRVNSSLNRLKRVDVTKIEP